MFAYSYILEFLIREKDIGINLRILFLFLQKPCPHTDNFYVSLNTCVEGIFGSTIMPFSHRQDDYYSVALLHDYYSITFIIFVITVCLISLT